MNQRCSRLFRNCRPAIMRKLSRFSARSQPSPRWFIASLAKASTPNPFLMTRTAVINVVGLTRSLLGPATPRLNRFLEKGGLVPIIPTFPALTCPAQSTYLTGLPPAQHGIVGNGWYNRELAEVQFWKQSNHLVQGRKIWEELRDQDPKFTCAKLFWRLEEHTS